MSTFFESTVYYLYQEKYKFLYAYANINIYRDTFFL